MTRVLLVPDLPLERWPSMDRYAHRLHDWLESTDPGFEVRLAASIGDLTRDRADGRSSGGYPRWWAQDVDPTKVVLPGPLYEPQRYVARYFLYPWWHRSETKRAQLVHILYHSYAHMVTRVHRRPAIVTVHDLMPVIVLRSPTDGWREGVRNRFLRGTLKALRLARAFVVGTEWLKHELATWLGDDRRITVVPFGVDRAFFSEAPNARVRGRADWRIPNDAFVVLHVGSTVERKNVPLVIHTVARLRAQADTYLLQVGGRFTGAFLELRPRRRLGLHHARPPPPARRLYGPPGAEQRRRRSAGAERPAAADTAGQARDPHRRPALRHRRPEATNRGGSPSGPPARRRVVSVRRIPHPLRAQRGSVEAAARHGGSGVPGSRGRAWRGAPAGPGREYGAPRS